MQNNKKMAAEIEEMAQEMIIVNPASNEALETVLLPKVMEYLGLLPHDLEQQTGAVLLEHQLGWKAYLIPYMDSAWKYALKNYGKPSGEDNTVKTFMHLINLALKPKKANAIADYLRETKGDNQKLIEHMVKTSVLEHAERLEIADVNENLRNINVLNRNRLLDFLRTNKFDNEAISDVEVILDANYIEGSTKNVDGEEQSNLENDKATLQRYADEEAGLIHVMESFEAAFQAAKTEKDLEFLRYGLTLYRFQLPEDAGAILKLYLDEKADKDFAAYLKDHGSNGKPADIILGYLAYKGQAIKKETAQKRLSKISGTIL